MQQFKALFKKNLILYRRNWFGSFIQFFSPILFALLFLVARIAFLATIVPKNHFAGQPLYTQQYYSQQLLKQHNISLIKNCTTNMVNGQLVRNGVVAIGPSNDSFAIELQKVFSGLGYTTLIVQNNEEINRIAKSDSYGVSSTQPSICFAVFVDSSEPDYSFRMRFNISDDLTSQGPSTFNPIFLMGQWNYWTAIATSRQSGLFQVNTLILNAILQKQTNNPNVNLTPSISPMGYNQHTSDQLFNYVKDFIDIFTLFPSIIIFLRMTSTMLKEKQKRIRQIMKVMGMSSILYYATWIIKYLVIYVVTYLMTTLVFYLTFNHIDFTVMFVTFVLFGFVIIIQSLFVQTFFIESVIGTLTALTFFFVQYIGSFIIKAIEVPNQLQIIFASICPYSALVMIMEEIFYSNFSHQTLTWSRITGKVYNYRVSIGIISLIFNIVVWSILTIYFEQVFPNEEGIRKHPLYFLGFPYDKIDLQKLKQSGTQYELGRRESIGIGEGIYFQKVWKIFPHNQKVAVKNFTLQIQPNSIFTLLGHNGAGKTTTLSMMAGITDITKGNIYIQGKSIKDRINHIKSIMGFCPQHNTLYDQLTVIEHLVLFSMFKFNKGIQSQQQIQSLLHDLQLTEKKNEFPNNLSGGQKRRLQLALAFVGGSKIIFLDQPTSGLDSYSRRKVWNFIRKKRAGKIIILTTHFMDEAEVLSDRLGIMKDGKLVCYGTPHGLKQKYKLGYRLKIEKQSNQRSYSEQIIRLVKQIFPQQLQIHNNVPSELTIQFPTTDLNKFIRLFEEIEKHKQQLKIRGYGVSTNKLEEVLLSVTGNQEQNQKQHQQSECSIKIQEIVLEDLKTKQNFFDSDNDVGTRSQFQQNYNNNQTLKTQSSSYLFFKRIWITISKRMRLTTRNIRLLLLEIIIPIILVLIVFGVQKGVGTQKLPSYLLKPTLYGQFLPIKYTISSLYADQFVNQLASQLLSKYQSKLLINSILSSRSSISSISDFDQHFLVPIKTKTTLAGVLLTLPNISTFDLICNTQSVYSPLVTLNTISQSIINLLSLKNITINPILDPLPLTKQQLATYYNPATSFMVAIIFSIAVSYKYGSNIFQAVKERTSNCKHLQIISGMSLTSFWLGNFIFDFMSYLLFMAFSLGMCKVFEIYQLVGSNGELETTIVLFLLFGISQQLFTYVCSFLFIDHSNAQSMYYFFNFMSGAMLPVVVLVFRYIGGTLTNVSSGLSWILRIIPAFSFGQALINLQSISVLSNLEKVQYKPMNGQIALYNIYYLGVSIPLFALVLLIIELFNWTNIGQFFRIQRKKQLKKLDFNRMDSIVVREALKTQQADTHKYPIVLKNVCKVYNGDNTKIAVNNLNLSIERGEVFGLLGVNGAGKSTTFKILTRDILTTSGQVFINGYNIQKQFSKIKVNVGYCPQFCALFQNLTVQQQLQLYYKIKGFKQNSIKHQVYSKLKMFNILQYKNVYSKDLSGGNQRKLSMAIALIGNPSVILLDEPSTGVDPYSKRFMWKIISNLNSSSKQTTVVLTTHSMEEAEYLSTRVGIMVNGNFKCLGELQRVKNKYSDGFFLELKLRKIDKNRFHSYLQKLQISPQFEKYQIKFSNIDENLNAYFPSLDKATVQSKRVLKQLSATTTFTLRQLIQKMIYQKQGQQLKYCIQEELSTDFKDQHDCRNWRFKIKDVGLISQAIILIQKYKESLQIEQYHINSTSLEQILNKLSEKQDVETQLDITDAIK